MTFTEIPCRAVLFDCDGVLVDSDHSVDVAWSRWAAHHGIAVDDVMCRVHGQRAADTVAQLVDPSRVDDAVALINRLELESAATVTAVAGARELVALIPPDRWAVVTSGTRQLASARLQAAGLPLPVVLITADDVTAGKPDPEGYRAASDALGVESSASVVVEDSPSGMAAARAAGVAAIVGISDRATAGSADVLLPDLTRLAWADSGLVVQGVRAPYSSIVAPRSDR